MQLCTHCTKNAKYVLLIVSLTSGEVVFTTVHDTDTGP